MHSFPLRYILRCLPGKLPPRTPSRRLDRSGFTLVEAIITFAIVGVFAAFLIVALSPMQQGALDARNDDDLQNAVSLYNQAAALGGGSANDPAEALQQLASGLTVRHNGQDHHIRLNISPQQQAVLVPKLAMEHGVLVKTSRFTPE